MPVDRKLWKATFSNNRQPGWPCPKCRLGTLVLKKDSLATAQTAGSLSDEREYHSYEVYEARFSCLFVCSRHECEESVAVSGTTRLELDYGSGGELEEYYTPRFFSPSPAMIDVPAACPVPIRQETEAAFALYWCDYGSSLNRVRNAIELILTDMGVKRHGRKKGGGWSRLPLDARINVLRSKKPGLADLCDRLLAVKHLGNAGSHPGSVKREDVFDGLDILEAILAERFDNPQGQLARMVREINRRKGPRKPI